jgi:hypothetical protein
LATATRIVGGATKSASAILCLYTFTSNRTAITAERMLAGGLYWKPYCIHSKIIIKLLNTSATTAINSSTV